MTATELARRVLDTYGESVAAIKSAMEPVAVAINAYNDAAGHGESTRIDPDLSLRVESVIGYLSDALVAVLEGNRIATSDEYWRSSSARME